MLPELIKKIAGRLGAAWQSLIGRLTLWKNTAIGAFTRGQLDAPIPPGRPEPRYVWRLGNTEKHCSDCLAFDGQVLTQSEWARLPAPQSHDLECGGWNCDCRLELVTGPATGTADTIAER